MPTSRLTVLFLTHAHLDHVVDVADLAMTRWIFDPLDPSEPLVIVAPEGPTAEFARHLFDPYEGDIAARTAELLPGPPTIALHSFAVSSAPTVVWRSADGTVTVDAVAVHHEPCDDAVAYRVRTPTGIVVVSGDTRVCEEVELFAAGADIVVHEACRKDLLQGPLAAYDYERMLDYHADTIELGAMAQRIAVPHLVLTHLIPPPTSEGGAELFAEDVRAGGFTGELTVGHDLCTVTAPATLLYVSDP